jgi:predicted O-methyltransferase YrrM
MCCHLGKLKVQLAAMTQETWTAVDRYFADALLEDDPVLAGALQRSADANLPAINVSPTQGKLLHLLAKIQGAKRILEIGTLGGYSTIWLARALPPDGKLITLEFDPKHAAVARQNLEAAGVQNVVDLRIGRALDTLPKLAEEKAGPFDLIFVDADKPSNPDYFEWSIKLTRPGSLIIIDNVVRKGEVVNESSKDSSIIGTRKMIDLVSREPRVSATAVQTVGTKGYDGFLIARRSQ